MSCWLYNYLPQSFIESWGLPQDFLLFQPHEKRTINTEIKSNEFWYIRYNIPIIMKSILYLSTLGYWPVSVLVNSTSVIRN